MTLRTALHQAMNEYRWQANLCERLLYELDQADMTCQQLENEVAMLRGRVRDIRLYLSPR